MVGLSGRVSNSKRLFHKSVSSSKQQHNKTLIHNAALRKR